MQRLPVQTQVLEAHKGLDGILARWEDFQGRMYCTIQCYLCRHRRGLRGGLK